MHTQPSCTMSSISAIVHTQNTNKTLTARADEVAVLRRRLSSPSVAYLNILVMGEIAPPAILHSTDINRSSQDTQQLRPSQTEPVRHGAGGGSTTRHSSLQWALTGGAGPKKDDCHRKFAYLREELDEINGKHLHSTLLIRYDSLFSVTSAK